MSQPHSAAIPDQAIRRKLSTTGSAGNATERLPDLQSIAAKIRCDSKNDSVSYVNQCDTGQSGE